MREVLLVVSFLIQGIAILMVLYTFRAVSAHHLPNLGVLERYHFLRNRYDRLRHSLLFVVALILVQLVGLLYYIFYPDGPITLTQLLVSDVIFIFLVLFLTGIYKERDELQDQLVPKSKKKK